MEKLKSLSSTAGKESPSVAPASTEIYYYVERPRGMPDESDINLYQIYSTYREAARNFEYCYDDFGSRVITKLNGRWYSVLENSQGQLGYKDIHSLYNASWHTREEIERGLDLNSIPVKDLMAIAAATAYRNGTLAKELGVKDLDMREYDFYEKFVEFFGKPVYELTV